MMLNFFTALSEEIKDESKVFRGLMKKIKDLNIYKVNTTDLFVEDLVYYRSTDEIEHGSRIELRLPDTKISLTKMLGMDKTLQNMGINISTTKLHESISKNTKSPHLYIHSATPSYNADYFYCVF